MTDLIDIGANLTHESFDSDRGEVLQRASDAGVARLIITGTSVTESVRALELAQNSPGRLFSTAGVHPHYARQYDHHGADTLRGLLRQDPVVAVGECGLDYNRDFSPRADQRRAFQAQLEIAAEAGLPVFLHERDAHDAFLKILRPLRDRLCGGVAHCFTGTREMARAYLDLDLHIGITGWLCDERRGGDLRDAIQEIPLDRVLIETDAPFLLPRDLPKKPRGRRNEPQFLPHILDRLATLMGRTVEEVGEATRMNAERLFRIPSL